MAQAETSQRRGASGSSRSTSKARASKGRSSGASSKRKSAARRTSSARKQASARAAPSNRSANGETSVEGVTGTVSSGAQAVSSGAQNAVQGVAGFVKKARTPLIAGGVAIAGLAGAAVLSNARSRRRKVLGVTMPKADGLKKIDARKIAGAVTEGAKRADRFGQRVSTVASSVQTVSETADKAAEKA